MKLSRRTWDELENKLDVARDGLNHDPDTWAPAVEQLERVLKAGTVEALASSPAALDEAADALCIAEDNAGDRYADLTARALSRDIRSARRIAGGGGPRGQE